MFLKTAYEIWTDIVHQRSKAYAEKLTADYQINPNVANHGKMLTV
jgi:hypothetical protein